MMAKRLRAMLSLAPARVPAPQRGASGRASTPPRASAAPASALLTGCAQQVLAPSINEATIRLLTRLGVEVVVAEGAGCCGALTHHMGRHDAAMASARANIAAWSREIEGAGLDAVVINASGCGTTVKDYGHMFRAEPEPWRERAATRLGARLRHQRVARPARLRAEPRRSPASPSLTIRRAACSTASRSRPSPRRCCARRGSPSSSRWSAHICCGSAGTYNLLQPEIAAQLRARKLENLAATRPDLVAAGNIGCLTQLAGGGLPMVHTVELLDWMAGGPAPAGLPKIPAAA